MVHLYVLPDFAWFTGATAQNAMTASGVVRSPVEKRKSVPAKSPAPLLPTGVAFIPNPIGIYVFILRYQEVLRNTKKLTITAQVQNG